MILEQMWHATLAASCTSLLCPCMYPRLIKTFPHSSHGIWSGLCLFSCGDTVCLDSCWNKDTNYIHTFFLLPFHFLFHFWMYFDFLHFQGQASQRTMTSVQNLNLKRRARSLFLYQNEKSIIFQSVHPPAFVACCNFMYLRNPCFSSDNGGVNWELNYRPSWVGVIQII